MKKRNFVFVMMILFGASFSFAQMAEVNSETSIIEWRGKKIGGQHEGNINIKSGHINMKDDQIVGGEFVIDMTSISNTDLKNESYNQKLVGHLKSDDFFGVEKFPTASFKMTSATKFDNSTATVTGDITIKGKTETISFEVLRSGNGFSTDLEIDRSKFDVRYGSNSFFDNLGDKAIDDIFTLNILLVVS